MVGQNGDYDKAEKLFHIGLRMATDMQHQNGITYVLDLMANLALQAVSQTTQQPSKIKNDGVL